MSEKRYRNGRYYKTSVLGSWFVMDRRMPQGKKGIALCTKQIIAKRIVNALNKAMLLTVGALVALAQSPPEAPTNLRVTTGPANPDVVALNVVEGANNPLGLPIQGYSAWWRPEPTFPATNFGGVWLSNVWLPEVSTNGVDWSQPVCHGAFLDSRENRINKTVSPQWNYVETAAEITNWTARIRRLPPVKIQ